MITMITSLMTEKFTLFPQIDFDNIAYNLTAAMLSRPMHFTAVQKIGEKFYNLDNLDDSSGKQPFSTFKSALQNLSC